MIEYTNDFEIEIIKRKSRKIAESKNHSHSYYEMLYIRSGNFTYFIKDKIYTVTSRNIILIDKNILHKAVITNDVTNSYFIIKFNDKFLHDIFREKCAELFKNKQLFIDEHQLLIIDFLFSKIQKEYEENKPESKLLVRYQLCEIITSLHRVKETTVPNHIKKPEDSFDIEHIIKYINQNIFNTDESVLSLSNIAKRFSMSPSYFSKVFKKKVGLGFKEYVVSSKILYAKKLMQTTNMSITDIAEKCGFMDCNYFSTVFKRLELISPSQYKKSIKEIVTSN